MAVTKIDIASRALIMIGSNPISSFTDDTTEALVTNNIYEEIIESTLCRARWRFATEQQQLSLLANTPTGKYEYAYQIPTSPQCLQITLPEGEALYILNTLVVPQTRKIQ